MGFLVPPVLVAVAPAWVAAETFLCKKMRVQLKEPWELNVMRTSGKRLAEVVALLKESVKPGTSTAELDELAESTIRKLGGIPSFLGYAPGGVPYPATICASPNDAVVHGIHPRPGFKVAEHNVCAESVSLHLVVYPNVVKDALGRAQYVFEKGCTKLHPIGFVV